MLTMFVNQFLCLYFLQRKLEFCVRFETVLKNDIYISQYKCTNASLLAGLVFALANTKLLATLNWKNMNDYISKLRILGPNSARNIFHSSAPTPVTYNFGSGYVAFAQLRFNFKNKAPYWEWLSKVGGALRLRTSKIVTVKFSFRCCNFKSIAISSRSCDFKLELWFQVGFVISSRSFDFKSELDSPRPKIFIV